MSVIVARISGVFRSSDMELRDSSTSLGMTKCQHVRRRMTEPLQVRHLCALLRSFPIFIHEKPLKLTTKVAKDTKNLLAGADDLLSRNRNLADVVRPL